MAWCTSISLVGRITCLDIAGQCSKPYARLMTVYQAILHLSLNSPNLKRRQWTFMETENLLGDGGRSFWKEQANFVEVKLGWGRSYGSATNTNKKQTLRTNNLVYLSHMVGTNAVLHATCGRVVNYKDFAIDATYYIETVAPPPQAWFTE